MRKHSKRRVHTQQAAVYQPSDFVSVVAIGVTALILVLSLFAMERFAGVPVSVHGESASAPSNATLTRARRPIVKKPSQTATRAAARQARTPVASSSSSSSAAPAPVVTNTVCANALCSNLLNPLINAGDPACMRSQQCVDLLVRIVSQPDCMKDSTCRVMRMLYAYYSIADLGCVTNMTDKCSATVKVILERNR